MTGKLCTITLAVGLLGSTLATADERISRMPRNVPNTVSAMSANAAASDGLASFLARNAERTEPTRRTGTAQHSIAATE